jgi:hypothetical protein
LRIVLQCLRDHQLYAMFPSVNSGWIV